jgi:hypothetical protein
MKPQRTAIAGKLNKTRTLTCEHLEDRRLLAGNVQAIKSGSVLILTGDNLANEVGVFQSAPGTISVFGLATSINGGGTTANFTGIKSVTADLRGGDDRIGFALTRAAVLRLSALGPMTAADRLPLAGNIMVYGGAGDDSVGVVANLGGLLHVDLGNGNDSLGVFESKVKLGTTIIGGDGDDGLFVQDSSLSNVVVISGNGDDGVSLWDSSASNVSIDLGAGSDFLDLDTANLSGSLSVLGGTGSDGISMVDTTVKYTAVINAGLGGNGVYLERVNVGFNLTIMGGELDDLIDVLDSRVGSMLAVHTLGGNDHVDLDKLNVRDWIFADLGTGNDELEIKGLVTKWASFWGGTGNDRLTNRLGNSIGRTDRRLFETII